jgi:hypothetical protein
MGMTFALSAQSELASLSHSKISMTQAASGSRRQAFPCAPSEGRQIAAIKLSNEIMLAVLQTDVV